MKYILYIVSILILIWLNLKSGSTGWADFSMADLLGAELSGINHRIVYGLRLPAVCTALLAGAALSLSGLLMQVLFQNPLAGPGIMGVSSGAGLFVSFALLLGVGSGLGLALLSIIGSMAVLVIIVLASLRFRSHASLLILGLMLGYMISSLISILQYTAEAEQLQQFIFWTMGSFQANTWEEVKILFVVVLLVVIISAMIQKPLDLMLLGEEQMTSLGHNVKLWRIVVLSITGLLVGVVSAFCGPLVFIGIAAPHVARMLCSSDIHSKMIPHTLSVGMMMTLVALFLVNAPWFTIQLPLNAVLSFFGAPVVIWLLIRKPLNYQQI